VESSYESGNEPSGSIKCWGTYRVAAQLMASRVVLSSTELVSYNIIHNIMFIKCNQRPHEGVRV
jgi:hypothetical protein